jgi:hypothetical protein
LDSQLVEYKGEDEKKVHISLEREFEKETWREKVKAIEKRRILEIQEIRQHLEEIKISRIDPQREQDFSAERIAYEIAINQLKNKVNDIEVQYKVLQKENDDLKRTIFDKISTNDNIKEMELKENRIRQDFIKISRELHVKKKSF